MSPLLGFTKLRSKLLDGSKTQTIRLPRKYPIKEGDKLYIYWKLRTKQCEKLGEGIVTKIVRKQFCEINDKEAILDGFDSLHELIATFEEMHSPQHDSVFNIITWKWTSKDVFQSFNLGGSFKAGQKRHRRWSGILKRQLEKVGYEVQCFDIGPIDIVAKKGDRSLAIEVKTTSRNMALKKILYQAIGQLMFYQAYDMTADLALAVPFPQASMYADFDDVLKIIGIELIKIGED